MCDISIEETLKRASERIRSSALPLREAQIAQAVVVPTLRALGWDDSNPDEMHPQYPVPVREGQGWVDFALLGPGGNPLVFIEAKRLGNVSVAGEQQLFDYATGQGVPLVILTDGDIWDFYLSMAAGLPPERRFYRAELQRPTEDNIPEIAQSFKKFLLKEDVISDKAHHAATQFHTDNRRKEQAKRIMPQVWKSLLQTPNVRELLVEAVEHECGTMPDLDDAEEFLGGLAIGFYEPTAAQASGLPRQQPESTSPLANQSGGGQRTKITGYILDGQSNEIGAGNRTLAEILKQFHQRDSGFMQKYAHVTMGRSRRLVAQNRDDLNNNRDMLEHSMDLENGWWMTTNLSNVNVKNYARKACEVAGVGFGTELTLIER